MSTTDSLFWLKRLLQVCHNRLLSIKCTPMDLKGVLPPRTTIMTDFGWIWCSLEVFGFA